jgi:hypothetical protein
MRTGGAYGPRKSPERHGGPRTSSSGNTHARTQDGLDHPSKASIRRRPPKTFAVASSSSTVLTSCSWPTGAGDVIRMSSCQPRRIIRIVACMRPVLITRSYQSAGYVPPRAAFTASQASPHCWSVTASRSIVISASVSLSFMPADVARHVPSRGKSYVPSAVLGA